MRMISVFENRKGQILIYLALFIILNIIALYLSRLLLKADIAFFHELHSILINIEREFLVAYFEKFNLLDKVDQNTLTFMNGNSMQILPGCSGLIQMFRIFFVLLFFPGSRYHKIWFIPLSLILVFIAAMVHLLILSYVIIYLPEYYDVAHNFVTKFIFYGMYFLIWVYWLEKFVLKKKITETEQM